MLRRLLFVLFIFLSISIKAQELVFITLKDTSTQKGIPSVSIANKTRELASTSSSGKAVIKLLPGNHFLRFSSPGYKTKELMIETEDTTLTIQVYLIPDQKSSGEKDTFKEAAKQISQETEVDFSLPLFYFYYLFNTSNYKMHETV